MSLKYIKSFIFTITLALILPSLTNAQANILYSNKKGIGLDEKTGLGAKQLSELKVSWFYTWDPQTKILSKAQFVPMLWSAKHINASFKSDYVLGFNEPDLASQANMTVEQALALWPKVITKAKNIGSPAVAHNPVYSTWFLNFMRSNPRVDFINVHWYKGDNANLFIDEMKSIHKKFNKPLWVTEYACQTIESSKRRPDQYTQQEVDQFINETVHWMEVTPWIIRYAWHDSLIGTSAIYDPQGRLTKTGMVWASAK